MKRSRGLLFFCIMNEQMFHVKHSETPMLDGEEGDAEPFAPTLPITISM